MILFVFIIDLRRPLNRRIILAWPFLFFTPWEVSPFLDPAGDRASDTKQ